MNGAPRLPSREPDSRLTGKHFHPTRFWPESQYRPGSNPPSFDKQFLRDWLETTGWDKNSPPPQLSDDVVARTRDKYLEAYERLTGTKFITACGLA